MYKCKWHLLIWSPSQSKQQLCPHQTLLWCLLLTALQHPSPGCLTFYYNSPHHGNRRRLAFEVKWGIWNNVAFQSLLSVLAVSELSPIADNAILWLFENHALENSRHSLYTFRHWHSFLLYLYTSVTTPKMSANENRSQVKHQAARHSWMGKSPVRL